ncbi:putative rhamnosyl transferase [Nesterenkonia sp. LB17]|uniref:glycosyltransferase n=1 Tax=Nesterenkonia sp. LB17 TaxID=2901230 RepID=UPI001F4D0E01|nr:glycosyltransferase [Nesterenkonia sp. LB17]MCH8565414.1 putative rhamnosyl transferase [Nesterenkonia sp. LB17]
MSIQTFFRRAGERREQQQRVAETSKDLAVETETASEPSQNPVFVGHTRFSVHQYGSGFFKASRTGEDGVGFSEEQYTSWLYSPERLGPRTDIFVNESIPQLALAARDHQVVHFVSYSPSLPESYKELLRAAADRHPFVRLNETAQPVSATPPAHLVRSALKEFGMTTGTFGVYRLDDDDILSNSYFSRMSTYITPEHAGWWVSLGRGYSAVRVDGQYVFTRGLYYPKIALGLLLVASMAEDGSIEHLRAPKHTVVDQHAPTILDSRTPTVFHVRHKTQDSTVEGTKQPFFQEAFIRIRGEGPADLAEVRELFPVIADQVHRAPGVEADSEVLLDQPATLPASGLTYSWDTEGALSLRVDLPSGVRLRPKRIRVRFSVANATPGEPHASKAHVDFFRKAKAEFIPEKDEYSIYLSHMTTGLGYLLCLEPPEDLRVTSFTFEPGTAEDVDVASITAFPLGSS